MFNKDRWEEILEALNANSSEEINSIVALMTELEAKLPTVQQRLLL